MKIKIGDLTKRQISKICLKRESCNRIETDESVCPFKNELEHCCMVGCPDIDDYDDVKVDIPEDI